MSRLKQIAALVGIIFIVTMPFIYVGGIVWTVVHWLGF